MNGSRTSHRAPRCDNGSDMIRRVDRSFDAAIPAKCVRTLSILESYAPRGHGKAHHAHVLGS